MYPKHIIGEKTYIVFTRIEENQTKTINWGNIITLAGVIVALLSVIIASVQSYKAHKLQIRDMNLNQLEKRIASLSYINKIEPWTCKTGLFNENVEAIRNLFSTRVSSLLDELIKCGESYLEKLTLVNTKKNEVEFSSVPEDIEKKQCRDKIGNMITVEEFEELFANINEYFSDPKLVDLYSKVENRDFITTLIALKLSAAKKKAEYESLKAQLLKTMQDETVNSVNPDKRSNWRRR